MRITDQIRYQGFVPQYQKLLSQIVDLQGQVASGQRITNISDDVAGAARAQGYNQLLSNLNQDGRNVDESTAWSQDTENVLNQATQLIQRARELAVQASDPTISSAARNGFTQEVDQLISSMVDLGTTSHRGHTLLAGDKTGAPSFTANYTAGQITSVTYNGDAGQRSVEITPGRTLDYNMLGSNENGGAFGAFRDTIKGVDVFNTLIQFRDNIQTGNLAAIGSSDIPALQTSLTHLTEGLALVGGTQTRMQNAVSLNEDLTQSTQNNLSKIQDTDVASAITDYTQLQTAYQAALNMGGKIMQTSLLDYVR